MSDKTERAKTLFAFVEKQNALLDRVIESLNNLHIRVKKIEDNIPE